MDAAAYFGAFAEACERAERSIWILAWDLLSSVRLRRDGARRDVPDELAPFLRALLERRPRLHIHVLSWDFAMIYALERESLPLLERGLGSHRRLHFHLDGAHPAGASQHQKVVVVDDRVAFVGGLDLTGSRWDTPEHAPADPRRVDGTDRPPYAPFHDVQMIVEGEAARHLGELARARWRDATGRTPREHAPTGDPWPPALRPDLTEVTVGISRTLPAFAGRDEVREIEALHLDAIAAARRSIFIESQYFTSRRVAAALAARLGEPEGPEVLLIGPAGCSGWLEENTMDVLRARLVRTLRAADVHGRLRLHAPVVPGLCDQHLNVHSKVLVIDDRLATVGSANLSNRSMGFDSECTLVIEADSEQVARAIASLRERLLAEHLGTTPGEVRARTDATGSLIRAVEGMLGGERTLEPLPCEVPEWIDALVPTSDLIDPEKPIELARLVEQLGPPDVAQTEGRRPLWQYGTLLATLLALAAAWRFTPLGDWLRPASLLAWGEPLRDSAAAPLVVLAAYVVGGLVMFPVTVLIVAGAMLFGPWLGFVYGMVGSMASALVGYAAGRALGRNFVRQIAGTRLNRVTGRLSRLGVLAIATVRMVPVAPFTLVNLVAGASRIDVRHYTVGSLLGMAPGMLLMTIFGDVLGEVLVRPTVGSLALAVLLVVASIAITAWMRRWVWSSRVPPASRV